MVYVTVYNNTGEILRCVSVFQESDARVQVKGDELWLLGYSEPDTHRVKNGKIVRKPAKELERINKSKAEVELRKVRDSLLRKDIDTINPIRWEAMDEATRQKWRDYRQNLLDLPSTTTDPHNPSWPEKPV